MMRFKACGLGRVVALLLMACGGTIDLQEGQGGGAGGTAGSGASGGSSAGGGGSAGNVVAGNAGTAGRVNEVGPLEPVTRPDSGVLAYDLDADGLGRAIYVRWLAGADNDCTLRLTDPVVQAKQPAFSPDGVYMAYAALSGGRYQIHVMTLATGEIEAVTQSDAGATSPAFSPDGSQLAYVSGDPEQNKNRLGGAGDLLLLDLDTRDVTTLLVADTQLGCCTQQALSPAFVSETELLAGTSIAILGVSIANGATRDLVPFTGRIPNPQDPAPAPDGIRYAFTDHCGGGDGLFIGRIDGTTGDTCESAKALATGQAVAADWGTYGYIAAEAPAGIVLVDDKSFRVGALEHTSGARNPAWAPDTISVPQDCL